MKYPIRSDCICLSVVSQVGNVALTSVRGKPGLDAGSEMSWSSFDAATTEFGVMPAVCPELKLNHPQSSSEFL